jgi:hypothetical protein
VGYGGAAVGLRHALYRWGATQALYIPPIQTRILPYQQKVKLYPVNSVYYTDPNQVVKKMPVLELERNQQVIHEGEKFLFQ